MSSSGYDNLGGSMGGAGNGWNAGPSSNGWNNAPASDGWASGPGMNAPTGPAPNAGGPNAWDAYAAQPNPSNGFNSGLARGNGLPGQGLNRTGNNGLYGLNPFAGRPELPQGLLPYGAPPGLSRFGPPPGLSRFGPPPGLSRFGPPPSGGGGSRSFGLPRPSLDQLALSHGLRGPLPPIGAYGPGPSLAAGPAFSQGLYNSNAGIIGNGLQAQGPVGLAGPLNNLDTGYGAGLVQNPFSNLPPLSGLNPPTLSGLGLGNNFGISSPGQLAAPISTNALVPAQLNAPPLQLAVPPVRYTTVYQTKVVPDHKLIQQNEQQLNIKKVVEKYQIADTKEVVKNFKRTEYIPTIKYVPVEITDQRTETVPIAKTFQRVRNIPTVINHLKTTTVPSYKTIQVPVRVAQPTCISQPTAPQAPIQQLAIQQAPMQQLAIQQAPMQQLGAPVNDQLYGAPQLAAPQFNYQQLNGQQLNAPLGLPNYNANSDYSNLPVSQYDTSNLNAPNLVGPGYSNNMGLSNLAPSGNIQPNIAGQYL